MIERVIENWLVKTNERSFEVPFCNILASKGYTVLHMTRHSAIEFGKDIIAVAPDGIPCAFQLKSVPGGRIRLRDWRDGIKDQSFDLVVGAINHPSIDSKVHHRAYLVTNGEIEEEVTRAIDDMNRTWENQGQTHLKLRTIVKGEIIQDAIDLRTDLWVKDLDETKLLLELFLSDGRDNLPKDKLVKLIESVVPVSTKQREIQLNNNESNRRLASAALLCSIAISNYTQEQNYFAEIEGWMIYVAILMAFVEQRNLDVRYWDNELNIAEYAIFNALSDIYSELKKREHFVEGNPLYDPYVYRVRITLLLSLISVYAIWKDFNGSDNEDEEKEIIRKFIDENKKYTEIWGEGAIVQLIVFYMYYRRINSTPEPDGLIIQLIQFICVTAKRDSRIHLFSPYSDAERVLTDILNLTDDPPFDTINGNSYVIASLISLVVKRNWKQSLKLLWPDITKIRIIEFKPDVISDFYRWRCEKGRYIHLEPQHTQEWSELKKFANTVFEDNIPKLIRNNPALFLLFLIVFPHRCNADATKWLYDAVKNIYKKD